MKTNPAQENSPNYPRMKLIHEEKRSKNADNNNLCSSQKNIPAAQTHLTPAGFKAVKWFCEGFFFFFPLLKANSLYNLTSHSLAKPLLLLMFLMWLVNGDLGEIFHHLPEAGLQFCAGFDGPCRGSSLWMKTPFFSLSCKFTSIF